MTTRAHDGAKPERLFTFASGGWVLVLTAVLAVVILVMMVAPALERIRQRPPGDGRDPATYGFDLSTCLVPAGALAAGQLHRDLLPPLVEPPVMAGDRVEPYNGEVRGKYLVPSDRVIGVIVNGEPRAYPLVVLQLHEVVNDILGGTPIAVTYNPLCDSAVGLDRRADGEVLELGVSGLLYSSNLLLYDRRPEPGRESLWSQLEARAVAGPAAEAGRMLRMIPVELTQWDDWLERHPATTVLAPDIDMLKRYQETSYASYFRSGELLFPVLPPPPDEGLAPKTPCVVVFAGGTRRLYPLPRILERAGDAGVWRDTLAGTPLTFRTARDPAVVTVTAAGAAAEEPALVAYGFWFAWHAMDPAIEIAR